MSDHDWWVSWVVWGQQAVVAYLKHHFWMC